MARYKLPSCVFLDQSGNVVENGTCSVSLAGTSTVASIYAASSGGSAVNSVTSSSAGQCTWYVDTDDYSTDQKFKITLSKTNFTSQSFDDVVVFPALHVVGETSFTWNPGDLADGAGETSSGQTVAGAAFGDYVMVSAPYDLQDIICTGYVQAANTVEVRIQNENAGGNVNLASGTWKVAVVRI